MWLILLEKRMMEGQCILGERVVEDATESPVKEEDKIRQEKYCEDEVK